MVKLAILLYVIIIATSYTKMKILAEPTLEKVQKRKLILPDMDHWMS